MGSLLPGRGFAGAVPPPGLTPGQVAGYGKGREEDRRRHQSLRDDEDDEDDVNFRTT